MDVRLSEEQEQLRDSARELLARECPPELPRAVGERGAEFPPALWRRFAELGWLGLALPERCGGVGLGPLELAVLLEETGRALLPGPFFSAAVLGGLGLALCAHDSQRDALLAPLCTGRERATLAFAEDSAPWDLAGVRLAARRDGAGLRLSGAKRFVLDAEGADWLLVPVRLAGAEAEPTLLRVPARAPGVAIRRIAWVDVTRRLAEVRFEDARVGAEALVGEPGSAAPGLARLLDHARVALAAESVGVAQRVLELAVAHARTREQFGRPIGSFQAVQHRCADLLVDVETMRSVTWYAAWALGADAPDAHLAACMARAHCAEAATRVAAAGIQLHGGQGFTWEQDHHLYYKRAKASELLLGDAAWHRELVARELAL